MNICLIFRFVNLIIGRLNEKKVFGNKEILGSSCIKPESKGFILYVVVFDKEV